MFISVFDKLVWCTIGPKSFLFGTAEFSLWASGAGNYDYIITNSINSLLIGSKCIPNGAHTNHCWANLARASKLSKNSVVYESNFVLYTCYIVNSNNILFDILNTSYLRNSDLLPGIPYPQLTWFIGISHWCT